MQPKDFFQQCKPEMDRITAQYEKKQAALLPLLNLAQEQCGYISPEIEAGLSEFLDVPIVHVREVVTFYTLLHQEPMGKYHFQVCDTLSCGLGGCEKIIDHLKKRLGIEPGQTSQDGRYSLTKVECLGACEMAPMMQLNDEYIGPLTPEKIDEILKGLSLRGHEVTEAISGIKGTHD